MNPPADLDAEQALIGAILLVPTQMSEARWVIGPEDFYRPAHQHIWQAMVTLHAGGMPIDLVTVAEHLRHSVEDAPALLHAALNLLPAASRWRYYVDQIVRASTARRLIHVASEAATAAYETDDPWTLVSDLKTDLASLDRMSGALPDDFMSIDELAERADSDMPQWIVPGWLRHGDRIILVAEEGLGKSVLTQQWATQIAQGVNPFWPTLRHDPCATLVIDLENPEHVSRGRARTMEKALRRAVPDYVRDLTYVWNRPQGIDLRSRSTLRELESILTAHRPSFVVLSPLYKAFNKKGREDHEDAAAAVQTIIDDLRARFGFALIIEHHAPKGGQSGRDFIPFGSSLWLRWPEYGITLAKSGDKDGKEAKLGRFRGDRIRSDAWPSHLAWGQGWPWEASYRDGVNPWHAGTAF